jgi:hypothetical protein
MVPLLPEAFAQRRLNNGAPDPLSRRTSSKVFAAPGFLEKESRNDTTLVLAIVFKGAPTSVIPSEVEESHATGVRCRAASTPSSAIISKATPHSGLSHGR